MPMPEYFEFHDRTKVVYGVDTLSQVGEESEKLGGKRALIVTDKVIAGLGYPEAIVKSLSSSGIETPLVFDDVPQDSDAAVIARAADAARDAGVDFCIGVGGGSALDSMKMTALILTEGGDLMNDHQGAYIQERPLIPMIAIPTTAGTGSEVTFAAVIKDREMNMKVGFVSHFFAPNVAILDPKLTVSMPPKITAGTGMDALTHAIESLHSTQASPMSDALAVGAIRDIYRHLPQAIESPRDLESRGRMLSASCIAGIAFSNSLVGIVHGIAHSIGGIAGVPHGLANSLMLPWCLEWNLDACPEKYAMMAHALGIKPTKDMHADAAAGIDRVRILISKTGLPTKLRDAGVTEEHLEGIANLTMGDGSIFTNPRPVEDPEEVLALLKKAF